MPIIFLQTAVGMKIDGELKTPNQEIQEPNDTSLNYTLRQEGELVKSKICVNKGKEGTSCGDIVESPC